MVNDRRLSTKTVAYLRIQLYSDFAKSQRKKESTPVDSFLNEAPETRQPARLPF